jgi:hypothetical protein
LFVGGADAVVGNGVALGNAASFERRSVRGVACQEAIGSNTSVTGEEVVSTGST